MRMRILTKLTIIWNWKGGKKDFEKLWNEINIYKNSHEKDKEKD